MVQGVIYILTNKQNGMVYIGQTYDLKKRLQRHLTAARNRNTRNEGQRIVHAIREYGIEAFESSVLETITAETRDELNNLLNEREKFYIAEYNATEKGYNVTLGGKGMLGYTLPQEAIDSIRRANTGRKLTEEHKDAIRKSSIKMWSNEEYRQYMSKRMSGKNNPMYGVHLSGNLSPNYGKSMPEETKRKISAAKMGHPGYPLSEEHKRKLFEAAKRPKSIEHRRKISKTLTGRKLLDRRKPVLQYDKNGKFIKEWTGISEAESELKIGGHISDCVLRKRNFAGGFIWRFKSDDGEILPIQKNTRRIIQMDLKGNTIREFSSIKEASVLLGICYSSVSAAVKGVQKKAGGFKFKYKD